MEARDQRSLIERLCEALTEGLASGGIEHNGVLTPWQATSTSFADLPAEVVQVLLDVLHEEDARLVDIDLGGLLATDQGVRAWGTLALDPGGQSSGLEVDLAGIAVTELEGGWRIELTLSHRSTSGEDTDG